jgi:preprotein translocase subunit SecA
LTPPAFSYPFPGVVWGDYPERAAEDEAGAHGAADWMLRAVSASVWRPRAAPFAQFAVRVQERMNALASASLPLSEALVALRESRAVRPGPPGSPERAGRPGEALLVEALALAGVAMRESLGLSPYPTQIMAARIMLGDCLAEMATGEGKTLAIALAAAAGALAGTPVHVITANDYLAVRDADALRPFYAALGLTVGVVTQPLDQAARRLAYRCDITYCTAKEVAFDYLRDGLARPRHDSDLAQRARRLAGQGARTQPLLQGLCMALIDEADTVLIDEARVPLILSGQSGGAEASNAVGEAEFLASALACARTLNPTADYELQPARASAVLTQTGVASVQAWPFAAHGLRGNQRHSEDMVALALTALHLYQRDRDYVVREGKVMIIDETTGRSSPGRAWARGLHQLIEIKENVAATARNTTVAQITYQRFFRRYLRLGGMSGTVAGSAGEMNAVYGLSTVRVPLRLPSRREVWPLRLYPDEQQLWREVAHEVAEIHSTSRPVLIGTASVAQSEQLSAVLTAAGLEHVVLNARQDNAEGEIVAAAGQPDRITVATSMAGRGTDIQLGRGVAALGGLHVILCQHNGSRRIDRQFRGRCARQGEPGTQQTLLCVAGPLFQRWLPGWWLGRVTRPEGVPQWLCQFTAFLPQWLEEFTQSGQRRLLCRMDEEAERELAFENKALSDG